MFITVEEEICKAITLSNFEMDQEKQQYRMVAFDLDGTLLDQSHEISSNSVDYLRNLHEKGFIISIATGRSPAATAEVIRRLGFHGHDFPVVTTNGAKGILVRHENEMTEEGEEKNQNFSNNPMVSGKMKITELFHQPVSMDLAKKTLEIAKNIGCVTNYYVGHEIYAHVFQDWHMEATKKYSNLTGVEFTYREDDYEEAMTKGLPSKLLVLCEPHKIDEIYKKLDQALGSEAKVIRGSPPFFVEVLNKEVNKGKGLELLCKSLGIELSQVVAFGDGDNDIEFLQVSGHGVAMKNARETLKDVADDITENCNAEDGAIKYLQRLESTGSLHY